MVNFDNKCEYWSHVSKLIKELILIIIILISIIINAFTSNHVTLTLLNLSTFSADWCVHIFQIWAWCDTAHTQMNYSSFFVSSNQHFTLSLFIFFLFMCLGKRTLSQLTHTSLRSECDVVQHALRWITALFFSLLINILLFLYSSFYSLSIHLFTLSLFIFFLFICLGKRTLSQLVCTHLSNLSVM